MQRPSHELVDRLAAEYVLGTLRGRARSRFARWLDSHDDAQRTAARAAVHRWEDRLVHLVDGVQPVDPSPRVWREVVRRTQGTRSASPRPWALAAGFIAIIFGALLWYRATGDRDWQPTAQLRAEGQQVLLWNIELDSDRATLRASALRPLPVAVDEVHELWALAASGAPPVSLGLLPQQGSAEYELTSAQRAALLAADKLAVSREPSGGSPTGLPTGPVVVVSPRLPLA
jgi:anti-sigma-K factor RskA